jgi:CRP-like cAMP-binding protein
MIIGKCLEQTNLLKKFKNDCLDETILSKILYFCSLYSFYKYYPRNKIIFKEGDLGERFYIIIKGKVDIVKVNNKQEKMTYNEYYEYLKTLKQSNENYIINKCLYANYDTYPVNIEDLDELDDIVFKVKYRKTLLEEPSIETIEKVINFSKSTGKDSYISELDELRKASVNSEEMFSIAIQKRLSVISVEANRLKNYRYIENDDEKRSVTLFFNKYFMSLTKGNYFGDYLLDGKSIHRYI